jgi:hypothetical protein
VADSDTTVPHGAADANPKAVSQTDVLSVSAINEGTSPSTKVLQSSLSRAQVMAGGAEINGGR